MPEKRFEFTLMVWGVMRELPNIRLFLFSFMRAVFAVIHVMCIFAEYRMRFGITSSKLGFCVRLSLYFDNIGCALA